MNTATRTDRGSERDAFCSRLTDLIDKGRFIRDATYDGDGHILVRLLDGREYHVNVTTAKD